MICLDTLLYALIRLCHCDLLMHVLYPAANQAVKSPQRPSRPADLPESRAASRTAPSSGSSSSSLSPSCRKQRPSTEPHLGSRIAASNLSGASGDVVLLMPPDMHSASAGDLHSSTSNDKQRLQANGTTHSSTWPESNLLD